MYMFHCENSSPLIASRFLDFELLGNCLILHILHIFIYSNLKIGHQKKEPMDPLILHQSHFFFIFVDGGDPSIE